MRLSRDSVTLWMIPAALIPAVCYLLTMCPTVFCGDSGELALAASELQIAHPPGYPLLTNLGHVWTDIVFFLRPILALNLLAATFAAATGAGLFLLLTLVTQTTTTVGRVINLALAVTLALGQTLWSVATSFEVYSLSALMLVLILLLSIRFHKSGDRRFLLMASYLIGLAMCNHLSVVSSGIMVLGVGWMHRDKLGLRDWVLAAFLAALPLTFYGYLYVRSSHDLILDWYDPETLWGLRQHIFAKTYQRYLAVFHWADFEPYGNTLAHLLAREFVYPFTILALPGAYIQSRQDRRITLLLVAIVIVNCGLNFNYLIPDIAPYYLPTLVVAIVWMAALLQWLSQQLERKAWIAAAVACGIAATTLAGNFARCNISDHRGAEQYAMDLLAQVPTGGTLFCGSDNSICPTLYLHYAETYRPDCMVYGHLPTLTRLRSDLGLKMTPGYNKFPDLVRYALTHATNTLVFAREPMQIANDFRTLEPNLFAKGLVYYADSSKQMVPKRENLDWHNPPRLYDQKEALLYTVYNLTHGEDMVKAGSPDGERLLLKAAEIVKAQLDFSMSSELSNYFVRSANLRLARKTLESGLALPQLRRQQRLRMIESLGSVVFESGDEKRAKEIFQEVQLIEPTSQSARYHLLAFDAGEAMRSQRLEVAIAAYRQMLEIYPEQLEVNLQLGRAFLQKGDTASAKTMFDICLRDNYKSDYIRELLK